MGESHALALAEKYETRARNWGGQSGEYSQGHAKQAQDAAADFRALAAQHERIVSGLEADAARYRWLKMYSSIPAQRQIMLTMPWTQWDAAIDAILAQTEEGVEGG